MKGAMNGEKETEKDKTSAVYKYLLSMADRRGTGLF